jgi:hypothetical protein
MKEQLSMLKSLVRQEQMARQTTIPTDKEPSALNKTGRMSRPNYCNSTNFYALALLFNINITIMLCYIHKSISPPSCLHHISSPQTLALTTIVHNLPSIDSQIYSTSRLGLYDRFCAVEVTVSRHELVS